MSKQFRNWLIFFLLIAVILGVTVSCQLPSFLGNEKVADISSSEGYIVIDSETILDALARGKTDVFTPQLVTPEVIPPTPDTPVQWSQANYFQIVFAMYPFIWNETLEGWGLERMLFRLDCADVINGPQDASIQFFKITHTRDQDSRLLRDLWINPTKNLVSWHEVEKYPNVWGRETIDFTRIKIPVEEALRIAEKNGGDKARLSVGNSCIIYLLLSPGAQYSGWQVSYSGNDAKDLFAIHIDPLTGEYEVVNSKTK